MTDNSDKGFEKDYTEESFWDKVKKYARVAGEGVLEPALQMYYAAQDRDTPTWAKSTMYGALGYFISTIDAIPDITPVVGYSDDLGVLVAALAAVASHIKEEHKQKSKETIKRWFD